jgi:hypothetical protein
MRSSWASRVFRLIGTVVFVAFAVWFTVRSTVLAHDGEGSSVVASPSVVFEGSVRSLAMPRTAFPMLALGQVVVPVDLVIVFTDGAGAQGRGEFAAIDSDGADRRLVRHP